MQLRKYMSRLGKTSQIKSDQEWVTFYEKAYGYDYASKWLARVEQERASAK